MFTRQGRVSVSGPSNLEDDIMALAIDCGADDIAPVPKEEGAEVEADMNDWEVRKVVVTPHKKVVLTLRHRLRFLQKT